MVNIVLFCYARLEHTKQVIDSLLANTLDYDNLYIFQDGKKESTNNSEWEELNEFLKKLSLKNTELIVSDKNCGLADAIVSGLNYVFSRHEEVIVLEDDCVTHPLFIQYMSSALKKYRKYSQVYCINGYSNPVVVNSNGYDAYFIGRASSWGWATWKDRWEQFVIDYRAIQKLKENPEKNEQFHIWGEDLECYALGNVSGKCNSWATFWCLTILSNGGLCLSPYKSLVKNIGFDGSGVHCGNEEIETNLYDWNYRGEIKLPETVQLIDDYRKSYRDFFHWTSPEIRDSYYRKTLYYLSLLYQKGDTICKYLQENEISCVAIWGKGELAELVINDLSDKIGIDSILVSQGFGGTFHGLPVKKATEIGDKVDLVIVIPGYDIDRICDQIDINYIGICDLFERIANK